ncbi:MAG: hypothetical protein Q7U74_00055, partial [Saprospiraceae bacterium]|nr:hypothetical protein [Saprospiraceae bacterium]
FDLFGNLSNITDDNTESLDNSLSSWQEFTQYVAVAMGVVNQLVIGTGTLGKNLNALATFDFTSLGGIASSFADQSGKNLDEVNKTLEKIAKGPEEQAKGIPASGEEFDLEKNIQAQIYAAQPGKVKPTGGNGKPAGGGGGGKGGGGGGTNNAASALNSQFEAGQKLIEQMKYEMLVSEESEELQRQLLEIRSKTAGATAAQAVEITSLIQIRDEYAEQDEILLEGDKLAANQMAEKTALITEQKKAYEGLKEALDKSSGVQLSQGNQDLNAGIAVAQDAFKNGSIGEAEYKETLDQLTARSNALTSSTQGAMGSMSVYVDQAARNMQSSFSEFLFDPFAKGTDDMLSGFSKTMQKMLAEIASAKLMEGLFGAPGAAGGAGGGGLLGGILGSITGGAAAGGAAAGGGGAGGMLSGLLGSFTSGLGGAGGMGGMGALAGMGGMGGMAALAIPLMGSVLGGASGSGGGMGDMSKYFGTGGAKKYLSITGDWLSSIFHDGGIAGSPAPNRAIPASLFSGAPRLHEGGYLKPGEVPAVLMKGEEVLTAKDPRHRNNYSDSGSSQTNNVTINVSAPNGRIEPQSLAQIRSGVERSLAKSARRNS